MRPNTLLFASAVLLAASPALALCKPGMVEIEGKFCIDKHEASLVEARSSGPAAWSPYHVPLASSTYRAVSVPGLVPQAYISGAQAQAACGNAGKRLCAAAEWLQACQGPAKQAYPYGKVYKAKACNEH